MEQNGTAKRKQPPTSPSTDRPMKQIKPETSPHSRNGVLASPDADEAMSDDAPSDYSVLDELPATAHVALTGQDTAEWQKTIESVVKSVVSIHFCQTCSFDTDPAISSEATGFVVDAEKGYILTNRVSATCLRRWGSCPYGANIKLVPATPQGGSVLDSGGCNADHFLARRRRRPIHRILYF